MTQQDLFANTFKAQTAAFEAAIVARNAHDFFTAEYAAADKIADVEYWKMCALREAVTRWWLV